MLKSLRELFEGVSAPSLRPVLLEAARAEVVDEMKERAEKLGLGEGEVEAIVPSVMSVEIANGAREGVSDLSVRQAPRCGFGEVGDGGLIPDGMSLHVDPAAMSPGEVREVRLRNGNVVRFIGTAEGAVEWGSSSRSGRKPGRAVGRPSGAGEGSQGPRSSRRRRPMRFPTFPIILIAALLTACSSFRADGVEDAPRAERAFAVLESAGFPYATARSGVRVLFTEMEPWRQGYFLPTEGEIHISPSMSEDQVAMTLAHELVHAWRWQCGLAPACGPTPPSA